MAKKTTNARATGSQRRASSEPGPVEQRVLDYAETLGRVLGTAQARATTWLTERDDVTRQLVQIRDSANDLLSQLGDRVQHGYDAVSAALPTARRASRAQKLARVKKASKGTPAPPGTGRSSSSARVPGKSQKGGMPAAERIRQTTRPPAARTGSRGNGGAGGRGKRG
jgi:hypothetical protein